MACKVHAADADLIQERMRKMKQLNDQEKRDLQNQMDRMSESAEKELRGINKEAVSRFGLQMVENLNNNIHKGHWRGENNGYLLERMKEESVKLQHAMYGGGDPKTIHEAAANAANFLMMIADNAVRAEEERDEQKLRWMDLMNEAGIIYVLEESGDIDFDIESYKQEAYQLARDNGLHTITDTSDRKLLRELGYPSDMLDTMTDEDCEAEVSHLGD